MFGKILLLAATATAGVLMTADNADARVGIYRGPNRTVVRVGGPARYGAYGYGGGYGNYGYSSGYYAAPAYGYSYPSYSYAAPAYGSSYPSYGYGYPSYGYGGYRGGYYGGRTFVGGSNRYYYRGPNVRVGGRW